MRPFLTSQFISHRPRWDYPQKLRQLDASSIPTPVNQNRYQHEEKYLSSLVILVLAVLVLPAISLLLYTVLNPEAFQQPLVP